MSYESSHRFLCFFFQCVFHERVKVYQNWQHSQLMLNKKREYKAKMELANRADKGNVAANEIIEVRFSFFFYCCLFIYFYYIFVQVKKNYTNLIFYYLQWESKVERCEEEFTNISKMIKKEMERFEETRVREFKIIFIKYMERQMKHQQQVLYWIWPHRNYMFWVS